MGYPARRASAISSRLMACLVLMLGMLLRPGELYVRACGPTGHRSVDPPSYAMPGTGTSRSGIRCLVLSQLLDVRWTSVSTVVLRFKRGTDMQRAGRSVGPGRVYPDSPRREWRGGRRRRVLSWYDRLYCLLVYCLPDGTALGAWC
eukprot:2502350-Rhodomonas_salina.5